MIATNNATVTVNESETADNTGAFSDVGADTVTISASIGTVTQGAGTWSWSFGTSDGPDDSQTVTITATTEDNVTNDATTGTASTTFALIVNNVAPIITNITAPQDPVEVNGLVEVTVDFADVGTQDTHTLTIAWDDSTPDSSTTVGAGVGTATLSHTYASATVATLTVTVEDDDTGEATTKYEFVVIFDASAGFVTGGGWIDSPEGAYTPTRRSVEKQPSASYPSTRGAPRSPKATQSSSSAPPASTSIARTISGWWSPGPEPSSRAPGESTASMASASC